jgi:hypothetical protein
MAFQEEVDPLAPQREAAMFYGLFLRGHSAETLRRDIDVPRKVLDKMMKRHRNEMQVREKFHKVYHFRKQVAPACDDSCVDAEAPCPAPAETCCVTFSSSISACAI